MGLEVVFVSLEVHGCLISEQNVGSVCKDEGDKWPLGRNQLCLSHSVLS